MNAERGPGQGWSRGRVRLAGGVVIAFAVLGAVVLVCGLVVGSAPLRQLGTWFSVAAAVGAVVLAWITTGSSDRRGRRRRAVSAVCLALLAVVLALLQVVGGGW